MNNVKLRLSGLNEDIQAFSELLKKLDKVEIVNESPDYKNRGQSKEMRRYIDIRFEVKEEEIVIPYSLTEKHFIDEDYEDYQIRRRNRFIP